MTFEPQKFFIGLIDFFSILLPGSLLTYVLKDDVGPLFLGQGYKSLAGAEAWIVFAFSAYLLGHFIFLLASWLLDDHLYDPIRKATHDEQIKRLAKGEELSPRVARGLAGRLLKRDVDRAVRQAVRIKEHYLEPVGASAAINAFQWCKARLTVECPQAMATVQRFEADSKFFRSLCIVLCVLIPSGLVAGRPALALVSVPLLVLAFWRYVDQRAKGTTQAYWSVITLEGQREGGFRQPSPTQGGGPSHAGGVVRRQAVDHVEYLLAQAKRAPQEWVLPKGHIERGEGTKEAAVREVREESGVWACLKRALKDVSFTVDGERVTVRFYLMEAVEEGNATDERRQHVWLPLNEALARISHAESQDLLRLAEQERATALHEL